MLIVLGTATLILVPVFSSTSIGGDLDDRIIPNDKIPELFRHFLNVCKMLSSGWYNKHGIHKNWQSYTQLIRGTIRAKVHSFRIQPFKGVNCGLIPDGICLSAES